MLDVNALTNRSLGNHEFQWSFQIAEKELMAVIGRSGIGKSTLLNTLIGFSPADSGCVAWCGQDITTVSVQHKPFGLLSQNDNLFEHLTVRQNLSFGLSPGAKLTERQMAQLTQAAERFQITECLNKRASDLSGGQQQRVALARVFIQNKPILLLDEPFSSLDVGLRKEGFSWVKEMQNEQGTTVIMVTHHLEEIIGQVNSVLEGFSNTEWTHHAS